MANQVSVEILLEIKAAQDGIKKLENQVEQMAKNAGKGIKSLDVAIGSFAGSLASAGFEKALAGAKQLFNFLVVDGVKAAQEQEDAVNRLNIALVSTGRYTDSASKDLQNFASAMQTTTKYSDDLITENMALLQSISDLTTDGLKQATKASLDLASALNIDLRTATLMVAKASEGNVTGLQKYGIEVKKGADNTETFANALDALNKKFGGAASGAVKTFGGQMAQMENALSDVQKTFGLMIVQNPAVVSAIGVLTKGFISLQETFKDNKDKIEPFITLVATTFVEGASKFFEATNLMIKGLSSLAEWTTKNQWVLDLLNSVVVKTIPGMQTFLMVMNTIKGEEAGKEVKKVSDQMLYLQENADKAKGSFENLFSALPKAPPSVAVSPLLPPEQLKQELDNEQAQIDKANEDKLAKQEAFETSLKAIKDQYKLAEAQEKATQDALELAMQDENAVAEQEFLKARLDALALIKMDAEIKELTARGEHKKALQKIEEKASLEALIGEKEKVKTKKELAKEEEDNRKKTIDTIIGLQDSGNKTLATAGKAMAIYEATMNTYRGVMMAIGGSGIPVPLNYVAGALVGAAGAVQIGKIAGMNFAEGGIVGGHSYAGDRLQANVNSGEMILNRRQQENLFESINGGGGGTSVTIQGNVIADDDSQIIKLIDRINDAVQFNNAQLRPS